MHRKKGKDRGEENILCKKRGRPNKAVKETMRKRIKTEKDSKDKGSKEKIKVR